MSVADRLNKLSTDITNAYTSIENKGGTIPANKNTNNLSTAINSIEVIESATAEGESLNLTNTKAMPYKDYVVEGKSTQEGTPSPSNPSEIHSVADDVNLFDKEKASINSGAIKTVLDTGVRITLSSSGTYKSCGIEIGGTELLGKTITLYSKITPSSNNKGAVFIYYGNSSNMAVSNAYANITSTGSLTKTLVSEFPTNCDRVYALFYGNRDGTGNIDDYVDYTDLKIQYGTVATPYSPYNQGTVTIKQRGKNKFTISNFQKSGWNVTIANPLKGLNVGNYTISCQNKHTADTAIIFSNEINGSMIGGYFTGYNFGKTITSKTTALTQEQLNANYLIFQGGDNSFTQEILENMQIQIEQRNTSNQLRIISR